MQQFVFTVANLEILFQDLWCFIYSPWNFIFKIFFPWIFGNFYCYENKIYYENKLLL